MIAELPTRSAPAEEDNLFAGMSLTSFPTAPTTAIVINKKPEEAVVRESKYTTSSSSVANSEEVDQNLAEEFETSSLLPAESKTSTKKPLGSLALLYATEVITAPSVVSAYPELPNIVVRGEISPQRATEHRSFEEEGHSEYSSLLGNNSNNVAVAEPATSESDPSLVAEILRENNRLTEELNRMRQAMEMRSVSNTTTTTNQQVRSAPAPTATTAESAAAGVSVTDTTMPPREGVKYVCCGGCRQWLLAPRDAVYVACGTCQAVNNCNLVAAQRSMDAETRAMTQAPARRLPWFLECFEGVL